MTGKEEATDLMAALLASLKAAFPARPGTEDGASDFDNDPLGCDWGDSVRVVWIGGEPWWVVGDACEAMSITIANQGRALGRVDTENLRQVDVDGDPDAWVTNEYGLWGLIRGLRKGQMG